RSSWKPNNPPDEPVGFAIGSHKGRRVMGASLLDLGSWKPNDPPDKPVGFADACRTIYAED
ncbi:MAG: hypothetical protein KDB03_11205, partial [Planctomycetales bacterium]|nr:hypothetical protein [Planctomycetales bacterium]